MRRCARPTFRSPEPSTSCSRRGCCSRSSTGGGIVTLLAPVDGVVLKRLRESASVVPVGEPLLEIGDPASLEIVSDLLSTDAVRVSRGNQVLVDQWGGGHLLQGRVRLVEPSGFMKVSALGVEEQRVNVMIDFADDRESANLGDGYRVEVRIVIWESPSVLRVPTSSLFRRGEDWAVFAVEGGRARLKTVTIDHRNGSNAELLTGLSEGARRRAPPERRAEAGCSRGTPAFLTAADTLRGWRTCGRHPRERIRSCSRRPASKLSRHPSPPCRPAPDRRGPRASRAACFQALVAWSRL